MGTTPSWCSAWQALHFWRKKPRVVLVLCSHERCSLASWLLHHQIPSSSPALKSGGVEGHRQGSE